MHITLISDTHGLHEGLILPETDLLIHAGDISTRGTFDEVISFLNWYALQEAKYKILIAGNHDFFFEKASAAEVQAIIPHNVIYLNDSGVEIEGIKIWGSPIQPLFFNLAFNRQRGTDIDQHWQLIPQDTDILVTHGPAYGHLDKTTRNELVGCEDLRRKIQNLSLRMHVCGHIHEAYGMKEANGVTYINASVLDVKYRLVNAPVEMDF